jgi:CubicO group peptidase (beta-lactamase class C family)
MSLFTAGKERLIARMKEIVADPEHPLMGASVAVIKDGQVVFADTVGRKQLDVSATADTKFRIASISKLNTAVGVWQLIEQGLIDPDGDISRYLGFELRNPRHPEVLITVRMLMSHTSSIRDGAPGIYNIPYGHHISEYFTEGARYYNPCCWDPDGHAPGTFFAYCNMNYCLLGTIIENVSGERFDKYMINHVYAPLGLTCSFNVAGMPEDVQAQVGTLYRKIDTSGEYDPANGTWVAQADDFTGGYPKEDYADYVIGTNGSLFGPMGSLRVSIRELCQFMLMLCNGGSLNGVQILKPETVEQMFTPVWTYDPALENGDTCSNTMYWYGMGPHIFTNQDMADRLVAGQDLPFAGHTADAYGLLGGLFFDRKKKNGLIYVVIGTGSDKFQYLGKYSAFFRWEEELLTAGADFARFDY